MAAASCGVILGAPVAQLASVGGAAARQPLIPVLYLPDHASRRQSQLDRATAEQHLRLAALALRFSLKVHVPPLPDDDGSAMYVLPPKVLKDIGAKAASAVRRDFMTSVASVARELATSWPQVVLGHGQGGLVAALVANPRIIEAALAIVYSRTRRREDRGSMAQCARLRRR